MRLLKPGGRALIYVWAFEQEYNKQRSKYLKEQNKEPPENHSPTNNASEDSHKPVDNIQDVSKVTDGKLSVHTNRTSFNTQDLLVPWHLKEGKRRGEEESGEGVKKEKRKERSKKSSGNSCSADRSSSSTRSDCNPDPCPSFDSDMTSGSVQETSDATHSPDSKPSPSNDSAHTTTSASKSESNPVPVFHRYYHVFQQGELELLCGQVSGVKVQSSYHDQGNWCVILEKDSVEMN